MVSYARSTYEKARQFHEKLKELQKMIKPSIIRAYFLMENEKVYQKLGINDEEKTKLEELKQLRIDGIKAEMRYAIAQAEKHEIQLSEEVTSGKSIVPGFDKELLNQVPSLGVYELFMLFTLEELESY